ncbi:MAG: SpaH/EbpB family LPXTG-anchored major pilin [Oscillospiraceae bacterium]|nr:SpaH/EbpB family LPXTG-anchored major pilin [Oscillospiraceae bacterium]
MKRVISLILSLAMVFSFATTAFATMEGTIEGGKITINDAINGEVYNAYQILYIESYSKVSETEKDDLDNPTGGNYAYKANSAWKDWLKTEATDYVVFDDQDYVTWKTGADAAEFAKLAQEKAATMTADATVTAAGTTVVFDGLKLGYYLVDTSVGTLCSLDTTNPTVIMEEKNTPPEIDKEVQEDSKVDPANPTETGWQKVDDADIGQVVNYKTTITAKKGAYNYVVHDRMTTGLTFKADSVAVTLNGAVVTAENYTVKVNPDCECWGEDETCTFTVTFTQAFQDTLKDNDKIVVTYSATVNTDAVVGEAMDNDTYLGYGNVQKTVEKQTKTYTWDMDVLKYGNGGETDVLAGAEFKILNNDKTKAAVINEAGQVIGWDTVENGTVLTTDEYGKIDVAGLDSDTYYLKEVKAPDGYNKLKDDVKFEVKAAKATDSLTMSYEKTTAKVQNKAGTELPSTGGVGTTMFYLAGAAMVLGSAVTFVTKKRLGDEE